MDKLIAFYDRYTIWQLSKNNLYDLAKFVVQENYKHHINDEPVQYFEEDVDAVYHEELRYYDSSHTFVAKNMDNNIIGAIRLMLWDGKEKLPIQSLFGINCLNDISSKDSYSEIWHIGRFAVSTDVGRYGLNLF